MTRLEILLDKYSDRRRRDTWAALGSLQGTNTTTFYSQHSIYLVNEPTSAIHNYLLYCKEDKAGLVAWEVGRLEDYNYGEVSFIQGVIDPHFTVLLTNDEFDGIVQPIDPTWVPFADDVFSISDVKIPDSELNIIMTELGAPFISLDELEYPRRDILNLMIKPAMEEYFKWFPKVQLYSQAIRTGNQMIIDFPEGAYDVVGVSVNQGLAGNGATSNPLMRYFDEVLWSAGSPYSSSRGGGGSSGPRTNLRDWGGMMLDRAGRQAVINYGTRVRHNTFIDKDGKRKLRAISNKMGALEILFAVETFDWNDVEFARKPELRQLCQSYVLQSFAALRSQSKADIPGVADYKEWLTRATGLREKVLLDWKAIVKYAGIIRGSG